MNHNIMMNNTECLIVCEALEKFARDARIASDATIASSLKEKINEKRKEDREVEFAEQLNMKHCSKKGEKNE